MSNGVHTLQCSLPQVRPVPTALTAQLQPLIAMHPVGRDPRPLSPVMRGIHTAFASVVRTLAGRLGSLPNVAEIRARRPHVAPERYRDSAGGDITAWMGGGFDVRDAAAELAQRHGRAPVPSNPVAMHDRSAGQLPYS